MSTSRSHLLNVLDGCRPTLAFSNTVKGVPPRAALTPVMGVEPHVAPIFTLDEQLQGETQFA